MPRVRGRHQFRHLNDFEKGRIVGMKEAGFGLREIARRVDANPSTVLRVWRRWSNDETYRRRAGSGRPRLIQGRDLRHLRLLALRNRRDSIRQVRDALVAATGRVFSRMTVNRRLLGMGLRAYRPLLVLPLTPQHKARRLEWCRVRQNWNDEWNTICFSDESRFCLGGHDGRMRVRRFRGERRNVDFAVERDTARQQGIMVWGAICLGSRSPIVLIHGNLTARRYIDEVLQPFLHPYLQTIPNAIFQQDNARPHIAHETMDYLQESGIETLEWPARSPDLSPIEHVWDMIGRNLSRLPRPPANLDELWHAVRRIWMSIPQYDIDHLILSMPNRTNECINNHGGATHY